MVSSPSFLPPPQPLTLGLFIFEKRRQMGED